MMPTRVDMEASLGSHCSVTMRRMWGTQASAWQPWCAISERFAGTLPFVQCLPYKGQKLKISKYSPADIVSQLLQWDYSAGIPVLSS